MNRDDDQLGTLPLNQQFGGGRWYPTLITLHNGNIIAICGHPLIGEYVQPPSIQNYDSRHNNTKPEVFDPTGGIKAQPGATVTALWSNPQHLDVFMTGTDGTVWSTFFDSVGIPPNPPGWLPGWFLPVLGTWRLINTALGVDSAHDYAVFYPRLHVVPHTGEVFIVQSIGR